MWDNAIYQYYKTPKRPFSEETWNSFGGVATDLDKTSSRKPTYTDDFKLMEKESFEIALHLYDGLTEGKDQVVPQSY